VEFNNKDYKIAVWDGEKLGEFCSIDTETTLQPFHLVPDLVTVQAYDGGDTVYYVPKSHIRYFFRVNHHACLIFHNAPFDIDVLTKRNLCMDVFYGLIDNDKVHDTSILYRLLHLAAAGFTPFKYNLQLLSEKYLNVKIEKDERRENFSQFIDTEITDIPDEYLEYGAIDAICTYDLYFVLKSMIRKYDNHNTLLSQNIQIKGDLALKHVYRNGIGFDLEKRDEWIIGMRDKLQVQADVLATWGWVRGVKGINTRFESILDRLGIKGKLPLTESGCISSSRDDLEPYDNFQFIHAYLKFSELEKAISFVKDISSTRIHPRYNLILNTGRTSCAKPNVQQLPRFGGVREMFIPEEGNILGIVDYAAIELSTLAQITYDRYGESEMRDRINAGECIHYYYATVMHNKKVEDVTKEERQMSKAPNFGFSGGLGIDTFIQFAKGYNLILTKTEAQRMKDVWFQAFPEMRKYMKDEVGYVYTRTGRRRGNTTYCAEKNTPFQGLAADGLKIALYELDKAGFKIVLECHDEIVCELSEENADSNLKIMEDIMIKAMKTVVPDVKIGVEGMLSPFYTK